MSLITLQPSQSSPALRPPVTLVKPDLCREKGEWRYKKAIEDSKVIEVALSCLKNPNEEGCWQISGKVTLNDDLKQKVWKHVIAPFQIKASEGKCIGSWDDIFVKEEVSVNIAESIPPGELGKLAHQTLVTINARANGVKVQSNELDEVGKHINGKVANNDENLPPKELRKLAPQTPVITKAYSNGSESQKLLICRG